MSDELDFEIDWDLDLSMLYLYKIQNGEEYFLMDVVNGAVKWTTRLHKAIEFGSEQEVNEFREQYLPGRKDFNMTRR